MEKFPEAHAFLLASGKISAANITEVGPCDRAHLLAVHSAEYLDRLAQGALSSKEQTILGLPPGPALLERSAREVEGTRLACHAALADGIAANLAGGTHHAFHDRGEGFCVLNDVAVAVRDLQREQPRLRILIVDTDAHQGNGTNALLGTDPHIFTYSIHVAANYPSRKVPGSLDVGLERYVAGAEYLRALQATLPEVVEKFRPDLAIWISGADPHLNDRFGQMRLSLRDMIERDDFVLSQFVPRSIPLALLYGGGYNRESGDTARLHRNSVLASVRAGGGFTTKTPRHEGRDD